MKKITSLIVSLVLLTSIFAGCTGSAPGGSSTSTPPASAPAVSESSSEPAPAPETAEWPRTITDAAGHEVTLETKPQRVAVLHSTYLEYFFALETPPVASTGSHTGNAMKVLESWETLKTYVGSAQIIDLGSARELNLEAILDAAPDVIVTFAGHGGLDQIYEQLQQIAPVVLVDFSSSWQKQLTDCAAIVGQEQTAQTIIQETEQALARSKEKLAANSDQTIAIFRAQDKSVMTRANSEHYAAFGITAPKGYPDTYEALSMEAVADMNPDIIVFQDFIETSQAFVKSQESSTVWNSLNAVKNDRIYYFDDSLTTYGPLATKLMAEKLVEIYAK